MHVISPSEDEPNKSVNTYHIGKFSQTFTSSSFDEYPNCTTIITNLKNGATAWINTKYLGGNHTTYQDSVTNNHYIPVTIKETVEIWGAPLPITCNQYPLEYYTTEYSTYYHSQTNKTNNK